MNYRFPSSDSEEVDELNNFIFQSLMNLGFPIRIGTIEFKNVIIVGILNSGKDLKFTESLKLYCSENNLEFKTTKSNVFKATYCIRDKQFKENFEDIFNYEPDSSFTTPMNLYECFVALVQLKKVRKNQ